LPPAGRAPRVGSEAGASHEGLHTLARAPGSRPRVRRGPAAHTFERFARTGARAFRRPAGFELDLSEPTVDHVALRGAAPRLRDTAARQACAQALHVATLMTWANSEVANGE